MKNKKGFTLIELLAVVIILGILMTVGGLAVTRITEGTRKNTFINTAQEYADAVRTLWSSDSIYCGSKNNLSSDTADGDYYVLIDSKDDKYNYLLEKNNKSPWGNRDLKGFVRVNVSTTPKKHKEIKYYVAMTDGIHAIKDNKESANLKKGDLEMDISKDQAALDDITKVPFDGKSLETCGEDGMGTTPNFNAQMVSGNLNNPQIGDMFSINKERFHVVASTPTTVTGLAEYNLYIGGEWTGSKSNYKKYGSEATGLQDSRMKGYESDSKPVRGIFCLDYTCDQNEVRGYLDNYKNKIQKMGVNVNEVRLMTVDEYVSLFDCHTYHGFYFCQKDYPWGFSTTSYLADSRTVENFTVNAWSSSSHKAGLRPAITINKTEFE